MLGRTMCATCTLLLTFQPRLTDAKAPPPPPPPPSVKAQDPPASAASNVQPAKPRGTGMYIAGIVLGSVGILSTVAGVITFVRGRGGEDASLVTGGKIMMAVGIPSIAIGVPLMIVGERRRDRSRAALSPAVGVNRNGWIVGLRLAF